MLFIWFILFQRWCTQVDKKEKMPFSLARTLPLLAVSRGRQRRTVLVFFRILLRFHIETEKCEKWIQRVNFNQKTKWILNINSDVFENCVSAKEFTISECDTDKILIFKKLNGHANSAWFCYKNHSLVPKLTKLNLLYLHTYYFDLKSNI